MKVFSRGEPGAVNVTEDEVRFRVLFTKSWTRYRKRVDTCALRIEGPFTVETSEGPLHCQDGYLCIDARGYPYPVAKDEFDLIYGEAP